MDQEIQELVKAEPTPENISKLHALCARKGHGPFKLVFGYSIWEEIDIRKVCSTCNLVLQGGTLGSYIPGTGGKKLRVLEIDL